MGIEARKNFLINIAFVTVVGVIIYVVFKFLSVYLLPFVIGIFVSFLVQQPVKALAKRSKIPKSIYAVFLVIFSYLAVSILLVFIGYEIIVQLTAFAKTLTSYVPVISKAFSGVNARMIEWLNNLPDGVTASMQGLPEKSLTSFASSLTTFLTGFTTSIVKGTPALLISVIVTIVASCYIASDYDNIILFARAQMPKKAWSIVVDIKDLFVENIFKILRGYLILMSITFSELCVFLGLLGKPNFIALAALIAIVDVLPVLGTGTIVIPWAVISLISGDIKSAVGLGITYLVITVVRNFLEPKVIGHQVGLNPLIMLIAIFSGLKLVGFLGMFLFPLILIVLTDLQKRGKIKLWKSVKPDAENGSVKKDTIK